jgi:hypothetical protein
VAAVPVTPTAVAATATTSPTQQQAQASAVLRLKTTSRVSAHAGWITTTFWATGPGTVTQLGTSTANRRALQAAGVKACSVNATIRDAGIVTVLCRLTHAAKRTRATRTMQVVLVTTFTPTSGSIRRSTRTITLVRAPLRAPVSASTPSIVTG